MTTFVAKEESEKKLKVLSFNVGLLYITLPLVGITLFENPPFGKNRLKHIPQAIREEDADIVLLQECYYKEDATFIIESLKDILPHVSRQDCRRHFLQLHNGLLLLSKFPVVKESLEVFQDASKVERYFACKSLLCTSIQYGASTISFLQSHLTAGGEMDPESPETDNDRHSELLHMLRVAEAAKALGEIPFICGDLNCGPEASKGNYDLILKSGYRDLFIEAVSKEGLPSSGPGTFTWSPENYLNTVGPHAHCPGQRVDHLFVSDDTVTCSKSRIIFKAPCVTLPSGVVSTLSDHDGITWEINFTSSAGGDKLK
jgi:endonuclease/exonuclease/phosphatase family metal-dependent hydrolase